MVYLKLRELPAMFRDAILVTRKLGIRYFWIDSLCVLQDSDIDWNKEGVRMAEYYGNSTVTIAASLAEGAHDGFLHTRKAIRPVVPAPLNSLKVNSSFHFYIREIPEMFDLLTKHSSLSYRG